MFLKAIPVTKHMKDYQKLQSLYEEAFPEVERYPILLLHLASLRKNTQFLAFYDEDTLAGMSFLCEGENQVYILYLAVDSNIRGKGYGTKILSDIAELFPNKELTLDIEPLILSAENYEQRVRRLAFYERNGFALTGYMLSDDMGSYSLLSTSKNFDVKDFMKVLQHVSFGFELSIISKDTLTLQNKK